MTDKELIQALREDAEWAQANEWETPITLSDHLAAAADRLEAFQWVRTEERMPEDDERVLTLCRDGRIHDMRWNYPHWEWRDNISRDTYFEEFVTHWMPIPAPPSTEESPTGQKG